MQYRNRPHGLFDALRCLEIHVIDSIAEAGWLLRILPTTVEHLRFHFDWRHARLQIHGIAWIEAFADLVIHKLHAEHKSIGADLYLERYLKTTQLDPFFGIRWLERLWDVLNAAEKGLLVVHPCKRCTSQPN